VKEALKRESELVSDKLKWFDNELVRVKEDFSE
jgi:hypothetical protein